MMDELMEILQELRPDVDFESETALITDGVLDSFDIVALVGELNDAFEFYLSTDQIVAVKKIDEDSDEIRRVVASVKGCINK